LPKQTFFNLPIDKKNTLIRAVKEEFSRTSLAEASVTNIVTRANIPRGSFYQYFEDKEDAYFYILSKFTEQMNNQFIELLKECAGDLFETMVQFFQFFIQDQEHFDLLKHAFLNLNYKIEHAFSTTFMKQGQYNSTQLIQLLKTEYLNFSTEKEFVHLMKILTSVTIRNFIEKFAQDLSNAEALENYKLEIKLLRDGLAKPI